MLIVLALTAVGYSTIYDREEREALEQLKVHLLERGRTESAIFHLAAANMESFRDRFLAQYANPDILPSPDFDAYFTKGDDGATRMRRQFFTGFIDQNGIHHNGISGFIGANQKSLSEDLKRRLVLSYHLLAYYAPAWSNRFVNTNVSAPENAMIMYWPAFAWGAEVGADLNMFAFSVLKSTLAEENPQRSPVWTPLYHDHTANAWMVSYLLPVDYQGRHLINVSHDVLVSDLMDRLITDHLPGSYNFIMAADGHLVAHPLWMDHLRKELATINLKKLDDPDLLRIHALVRDSVERRQKGTDDRNNVWIVDDMVGGAYLAVTRLDGPDWWFIAHYPKSLVAQTAHEAARAIMAVGTAYFLAMLALTFILLRRRVAGPIRQLTAASEAVAAGDYAGVADGQLALPVDSRDEIALLAKSFRHMAGRVRDASSSLAEQVTLRTEALNAANRELLEWSLHDALTGVYNRNAFDADLDHVFQLAQRDSETVFALVMADIDHFQSYNDAYGEVAGDQILRTLFRCVARHVGQGDRVYRYGDDRLAIILTGFDRAHLVPQIQALLDVVTGLALLHSHSPHGIVTLSAGVVCVDDTIMSPQNMVDLALRRLRTAHSAGDNRLCA